MISPIASTTQKANPLAASSGQTAALASDFETFLLMLTAQARHQDPLEPLDSSEYAAQLAQFSMVEQQVQTNDLLTALTLSMSSMNLEELASWVGMDVRSTSPFQFDGAPVTLYGQAAPAADGAVLVIRDADGAEVERITVQTTDSVFVWAGTKEDGTPLPAGTYSAALESYDGEEVLSTQPMSSYAQVIEAQVGEDTVLLTLENGQVIPAGLVSGVRTGT
ncbi:flagellar hook capping FlgD N-terminal domain-containing protein [Ruegeria lacuscaerulensis]|uniref:flagellar hook capping FlgD N-terminal domain-containing protein n=1 Tax=Ruegeria lacuscaerulensis TaxID=55218 RepID=UPI00147F6434|nr:flagellar hook capping FlgD N-terminal domain-containing protein [Ruegeria lacuscaerulensis]